MFVWQQSNTIWRNSWGETGPKTTSLLIFEERGKKKSLWWRVMPPSVFCYSVSEETIAGAWQSLQTQGPEKGIKSAVFHQLHIPNISPGQADSARLPRKTYGIQLKGSSFSKTVSFSLNFLRRVGMNVLSFKKKKKKKKLRYCSVEKGLNSARTLPPFTLGVVQRCVCFQKCEQTFVIITCHFHPPAFKKISGGKNTHVHFLWFAGGSWESSVLERRRCFENAEN